MSVPLVSVVVPAYNAARYVAAAIDSALAQTYPNVEVIVVDDGSTDATAEVVKGYGDRVLYLRQENARQAAARNLGLRRATGEFVAFLDADDVWLPEKLEKQLSLFEKNPSLGLVYCSLRRVDAEGNVLGDDPANLRGRVLAELLLGRSTGGISGSTLVTTRAVLQEVGGFDPALPPCEDLDLALRVASRYPLDYVDEPLVLYRQHGGNSHLDTTRMTAAWKLLYRKASMSPEVLRRGRLFWHRCQGRLYFMLAGDHWHAARRAAACRYAGLGACWWPPTALRAVGRLAARRKPG